MSNWIYTFLIVISQIACFAQVEISKNVLSSSGGTIEVGNRLINFTVGESFISQMGEGQIIQEGFNGLSLILVTALEEREYSITIYPNPFDSKLIIKGSKKEKGIAIFTQLGVEIEMDITSQDEMYEVNLENVASGTYVLIVDGHSFLIQKL